MKFFNKMMLLAGLILFSASFMAQANNCNFSGNTSEESHNVNFGNIIVQRDLAVGSTIATAETGDYAVRVGCKGSFTYRLEPTKWTTLSALGNKIYNTNIPGVGAQIVDKSWNLSAPFDSTYDYGSAGGAIGPYRGYKVILIKTGDITGGTLETGTLARGSIVNEFYYSDVVLDGTNTISSVACTVTSQEPVSVALGEHDKSEFGGVGSSTGWTAFDIGLQCDKNARINVRIDATQDASGITGVMRLDNDQDAASGVGVELWYQHTNTPVAFGKVLSNYWTSGGGPERVQLQARYRQTAETVTAGAANATATFTLTYQ
ncbi:TPA: fimbrial protein [Citrobacter braakii]